MLLKKHSISGTISEIFNVIGKAAGKTAEELRWWNIEKAGNSNIIGERYLDFTIAGKSSSNKPSRPKKRILSVGRLWIYSSVKDNDGEENWVLKTFEVVEMAKEYYREIKDNEGLIDLLVFYDGELIKVDGLEFDLYEVNYLKGVSAYFRTKDEVVADLIRYNNLEDRSINDTSTIKVIKQGNEIPYQYNKEANIIEWL